MTMIADKIFLWKTLLFLLLFAVFFPLLAEKPENDIPTKRVLLVHSKHSTFPWTEQVTQGFLDTIGKMEPEAAVDVVHLDILRTTMDSKAVFYNLIQRIKNGDYGIVVISDDHAIEMFRKHAGEFPAKVSFVFIAWYNYTPSIRDDIPNSTGLIQDINILGTLNLALKCFVNPPSKVAIVTDNSSIGKKIRNDFKEILKVYPSLPLVFINEEKNNLKSMIREVEKLPQDSLTIFTTWNTPDRGDDYSAIRGLGFHLASTVKGALFSPLSTWLGKGIDGGVMSVGTRQGKGGAKLVCKIIRGTPASLIPFQTEPSVPVVDYLQIAKKPFLTTKNLPSGTLILNTPPSVWRLYHSELVIGACVLLLAIGIFLMALRQKKRTQKTLSELFTALPLQVGVTNRSGQILHYQNSSRNFSMQKPPKHISDMPDVIREKLSLAVREMFSTGKSPAKEYRYENKQMLLEFVMLPHGVFGDRSMMWITSDITKLHQAYQEAASLLQRFKLTLESIGDGVIVTDEDAKITRMNPVAAHLTGYSQQDAAGMPLDEIFRFSDTSMPNPVRLAIQTKKVNSPSGETILLAKDGKQYHIAVCAAPICDEDNITGTVLVFRDITEEYKRQNTLSLQNELLKNAAEIANIEYFHYDKNGNNITIAHNPSYWGVKDGKFLHPKEWIAPNDYPDFAEKWQNLLLEKTDSICISYRTLPEHGQKYFEMRVVRSQFNDAHTKYFGIIQDITNSRENEQKYKDNALLLQRIVSNLPGFLFVKDISQDFRYVMCNKGFEKLCGHTEKDIVGHSDYDIFTQKEDIERFRQDDQALLANPQKALDHIETCSDSEGNQYTIRIMKTLVPQMDGTNFILGMGMDITREHQMEQERIEIITTLNHYIYCEKIINQCLKRISLENNFDVSVKDMLRIIGENNEADRCYIFRYSPDYLFSDNIYEWVREKVQPQIQYLQHVDMKPYACWQEILQQKEDIILEDIKQPPQGFESVAGFLAQQNIKSILVSGIWVDNKLWGYIGMDFVRNHKAFAESDIHTLHSSVNIFLLARERDLQKGAIADTVSLQHQIVENIFIPIALFDLNKTLVTSNPKFAEICELDQKELAGKKWEEILCRAVNPPDSCPMQEAMEDHKEHTAEVLLHNRRLLLNAQPIFNRKNELIYILQTAFDITELTRQKEQLRTAMQQAQTADKAKSFFIATMSHELRTPLNAIIGFSELLQGTTQIPEEEQKECLKAIYLGGNALLNMINDILDLSKIEADQIELHLEPLDVNHLLQELKTIFQHTAQTKKLNLAIHLPDDLPILLLDHKRLRQVLLNLIGNALKFTQDGGVDVAVMFLAEPDSGVGTLRIHIKDSGIGIAPENLEHMFEPFVQHKIRGNRIYEGTGLGLTISQRLCHKMGGGIEVSSKFGEGSCFMIVLPNVSIIRQISSAASGSSNPPPVLSEADTMQTVLLVDDVPINLKVLGAMLKRMNIRYIACNSAKEAIEQMKQVRPAVILSDIWMPEMNGEEFAQYVLDNPETAHIPIVAVTADTEMTQHRRQLFSSFIFKPITSEKLRQVLSPLLHRASYRQESEQESVDTSDF